MFFGKFEDRRLISFFFFKNLAVENSLKNRPKTAGVSLLRSHLLRLQPLDNEAFELKKMIHLLFSQDEAGKGGVYQLWCINFEGKSSF